MASTQNSSSAINRAPKKTVHWKWVNETCDEFGNRELVWADPGEPHSSSRDPNVPKISLRFKQDPFNYPHSSYYKLPTSPPTPILQPLRGDADVPILDLYNLTLSSTNVPPLKPALKTPYAAPYIRYSLSGVYTQQEWSLEPELGRTVVSRATQIKNHFFFAHGDSEPNSLELSKRVLDELVTDFITEICFEAARSAQLSGRQKIKLDDVKFACRKHPQYLGKIEEVFNKRDEIHKARQALDVTDDKIMKSNAKGLVEEPLGDVDDDLDLDVGGKSSGRGAGK